MSEPTATSETATMATLQTPPSPDLKIAQPSGLPQRIWTSLHDSIGEIVFGMVFGVAASAPDATTVLLAGATGAAAAAVSMMAGTFLDMSLPVTRRAPN